MSLYTVWYTCSVKCLCETLWTALIVQIKIIIVIIIIINEEIHPVKTACKVSKPYPPLFTHAVPVHCDSKSHTSLVTHLHYVSVKLSGGGNECKKQISSVKTAWKLTK